MKLNLYPRFKNILITGGAGFIGGNMIKLLLRENNLNIYNIDKISYASDILLLNELEKNNKKNYTFLKVDLFNQKGVINAVELSKPDLIIHFAAESHVDRSIDNPSSFLKSNIIGTFNLLEATRNYWDNLSVNKKEKFRFIHVSTDEVFGSLSDDSKFNEEYPYNPTSPYSATKASSDHLVSSWFKTYQFPSIISNCSNNYGPRQFPEKLIPLSILKIINNEKIPIYGNGINIRDWLYVEDHLEALLIIALKGSPGKKYCIGGGVEVSNLELINLICNEMDKRLKRLSPSNELISFVDDRPGHDYKYSIKFDLINSELGWQPSTNFKNGINKTLEWYINHQEWCKQIIKTSKYNLERLG